MALVNVAATALKKVAKRLVLVLLVVEPFVDVKFVVVAFSAKRKVEDARVAAKLFVAVAFVKVAVIALKKVAKRLVLVLLVVDPKEAVKLVAVAFSAKRKVEDARVAAKLLVPVAFKKVTPPVNVPAVE